MANIAPMQRANVGADGFFRIIAIAMAITIIAGFSMQFAMGRSTLGARPLVHLHGLVFMGWVALFVTQSWLATRGSIALHRKLGWVGAAWAMLLVVMGFWLTIDVVQRGSTPFFFQPQHFLIGNPVSVVVFAFLVGWAIRMRKRTDWHMRLHICAMAAIIGPAFGRLLPMPLLIPNAFEIAVLAGLIFPAVGIARDLRREGRVHPAWWWGVLAIISVIPAMHLIGNSAIGDAIYAAATAGHPGALVPGLEFPQPPPPPMP